MSATKHLQKVAVEIDHFITELGKHFNSGTEISVIVRDPKDDERVLIMSNDNLDEVARVLKVYSSRKATRQLDELGATQTQKPNTEQH